MKFDWRVNVRGGVGVGVGSGRVKWSRGGMIIGLPDMNKLPRRYSQCGSPEVHKEPLTLGVNLIGPSADVASRNGLAGDSSWNSI